MDHGERMGAGALPLFARRDRRRIRAEQGLVASGQRASASREEEEGEGETTTFDKAAPDRPRRAC